MRNYKKKVKLYTEQSVVAAIREGIEPTSLRTPFKRKMKTFEMLLFSGHTIFGLNIDPHTHIFLSVTLKLLVNK